MFARVGKPRIRLQDGAALTSKRQSCPRKSVSDQLSFPKRCLTTLYSSLAEANPAAPEAEFEIEHVYGYRAADCQQNLRYTSEGKAVYMVAALGVVMDTDTCQQSFYGGKTTEMGPKHENSE